MLHRFSQSRVRVDYLSFLLVSLLLSNDLVLIEILEAAVQHLTDLHAVVHELLDYIVVKVVLLKGANATKHTLLQLEEADLVCWLYLSEHLVPKELQCLQESWVTTAHDLVDIGVICAGRLNAHFQDLAQHVPVQAEHIRKARLLESLLHGFKTRCSG